MTDPATGVGAAGPSEGALARASARLALLWCVVAVLGLPFALRDRWTPLGVVVEVALAGLLAVAVTTFGSRLGSSRPGRGRAAAMLGSLWVVSASVGAAAAGPLRPEAAHLVVSWTGAGVGGALGLRFGGRWGLAALTLGMAAAFGSEFAAGGTIAPDTAVGPVTYVLGAVLVRGAARRGEAATDRAVAAGQAADGALRVAERRWEAARAVQRELHDTVLATLTLLAHGGAGVPMDVVARACARDAELLRRGAARPAPAGPAPGTSAGAAALYDGEDPDRAAGGPELIGTVRAAVDDVRGSGFDVRLHVATGGPGADGPGAGEARLSVRDAEALRDAVREGLRNARRHSGVLAADVTVVVEADRAVVVVVDEGQGFDPTAVPADRLGLRDCVVGRLADVGGEAMVWSGAGLGTSLLLVVPLGAPAERS